jgi:hypothetical protein
MFFFIAEFERPMISAIFQVSLGDGSSWDRENHRFLNGKVEWENPWENLQTF